MKVYMIRHGQSESNAKNIHGGWDPSHLTEQGRADAAVAGKRLEGISFDKVYTSDLNRAVETQRIALPDVDAEKSELIREINVGDLMGTSPKDCLAQYGESYRQNRCKRDFADYGGESHAQLCERVEAFLKSLEDRPYQNVAVFTHGGVIRATMEVIVKASFGNTIDSLKCANCSVFIFEYTDSKWQLDTWNFRGEIQK